MFFYIKYNLLMSSHVGNNCVNICILFPAQLLLHLFVAILCINVYSHVICTTFLFFDIYTF